MYRRPENINIESLAQKSTVRVRLVWEDRCGGFLVPAVTRKNLLVRQRLLKGVVLSIFSILIFSANLSAATYYLTTIGAAKAETPSNWNTGGTGGGGTAAQNFTTAGDVFIIETGIAATFNNTVFGSATAGVTLQINGTARISNGKTLKIGVAGANSKIIFTATSSNQVDDGSSGVFILDSGSTLVTANINGIIGANASITALNNGASLATDANYEFNGANQTTTGLPTIVNNLTLSGSGSKTLTATQVNGTLLITGTVASSAGTSPTFGPSGILRYSTTTNHTTGTAFPATFGGAQVVVDMAAGTTLTLNANRTLTLANLVINTGTLDLSTFTINRGSAGGTLSLANGATLSIGGTNSFPANYSTHTIGATSTVDYYGTTQTVGATNYGHLTLRNGSKTLLTGATQIAGNFTMNNANTTAVAGLSIGGNMDIQSAATFNGASFTHNVAGNWLNAGTFNAATSNVVFNGANNTQSLSGTNTFNNLTINHTGSGSVSGVGSTLAVTSLFRVQAGTFTSATIYNNVQIDAGATLASTAGSTTTVTGNWTNNGAFTASTGTVVLAGTTTQTIAGSSSTIYYNLTMNGTGLKVLGVATSVSNTLSLTLGLLDIGNFNLTAGTTSGGSATSYVKTSGTGRLKQALANSGSPVTKNYPVGNSAYNPASITNNTDGTTVNIGIYLADGFGTTCNDPTKNVGRRWFITKDEAGTTNVTAALTYNNGEGGGSFNASNIKFGYFSGTYWNVTIPSSIIGTTVTATGNLIGVLPDAYMVIGSGDSFDAKKLSVTVSPAPAILNGGGGIITVKSVNDKGYPTNVMANTSFDLTATNTTFTATTTSGTIAANSYSQEITGVTFTTATITPTTATVSAIQTSGDNLVTGVSDPFVVNAGTIWEPYLSGGTGTVTWDSSNWRKSLDGGITWSNTVTHSTSFAPSELIRIPSGYTLQANVGASFYSMLIEGTVDIVSGGALTLYHSDSDGDYNVHVHGILKNSGGTFTNTNTKNPIDIHGGTYWHARDGESIPVAYWRTYNGVISTCLVTGITSTALTGLNQEFQIFTWNNVSQSVVQNLDGDMAVSDALNMISGKITTANHKVILTANSSSSSSASSYIVGNVRKYVPNSLNPLVTFPYGDASNYAPISIQFAGTVSGSGYIDGQTMAGTPPFASTLSQSNYIKRKWTYQNNGVGGFSSFQLIPTWSANDEVGTFTTLRLSINVNNIWAPVSGTYTGTTFTTNAGVLTSGGGNSAGELYLGESTCSPTNAIWMGIASADWNTGINWCTGIAPSATTDVTIPGGIGRYPVISSTASCNNLTIMSGAGLTVSGTVTFDVKGNFTNSGSFSAGAGTVAFTGTTTQTVTGTTTFNNLTVNNSAGVIAGSNFAVNGTLYAQSSNPLANKGALDMGTYTLLMGPDATNTGDGDVTGIITRTSFEWNTFYTFGHRYTGSNFVSGQTLPSSVSLRVSIGSGLPGWTNTPNGFVTPVTRKYEPVQTGGQNMRVYSRFYYNQSEVPSGVDESTLAIWVKFSGSPDTFVDRGWYDYNETQNWISISDENFTSIPSNMGDVQIAIAPTSQPYNTWDGSKSTAWNTPENWLLNHVPTMNEGVLIPVTVNNPLLPESTETQAVCKYIIIQSGGVLNGGTNNATLTIYDGTQADAWIVEPADGLPAGSFNAGNSTVIFSNPGYSTYAAISGTTNFYNLTVNTDSRITFSENSYIRISGTLLNNGIIDATQAANTVEFNGADQSIPNPNYTGGPGYHDLVISGSGTKTLPAILNVCNSFINNGTVDATSQANTVVLQSQMSAHQIMVGGTTATVFKNLTINNEAGVMAMNSFTVNGTLYLQSANPDDTHGALDMGTYTLTMTDANATVTGGGDVTGIVTRKHTFEVNVPYQFGNQYTKLEFLGITSNRPTEVSCKITIGEAPTYRTGAVKRIYNWAQTGTPVTTDPDKVRVQLHYLESELNGNSETKLVFWDYHIGPPTTTHEHGKTSYSTGDNWVSISSLPSINYFASSTGFTSRDYFLDDYSIEKNIWIGLTTTPNWHDAANWSKGNVPVSTDDVLVPIVSSNRYPTLTADAAAGTIEILSGASLSAGTFSITVYGKNIAWSNQGTFDPGTGTVNFVHGTLSEPFTIGGTNQFHNLYFGATAYAKSADGAYTKISGSVLAETSSIVDLSTYGNTVEYNGTDQVIVNPQTVGYPNKGYYNLIISGSGTKTIYPLQNGLDIAGNFTNNGTVNFSGKTVSMIGTAAQTLGGTSATTFDNLVVNNSDGVWLDQNETISGTITLSSGIVTTGNYTLTIASSGTISGASSSRYINGKLAHIYSGTGSKIFPVGKGGNYRPVILEYTALTATSTVTVEQMESTLPGTLPAGTSLFSSRYWNVTQAGGTGTYNITLDGNGYSPYSSSNVRILKGDGNSYETYTTTYSSPNYTATGLTSFSYFGLGEYGTYWKGLSTDWFASTNWSSGAVPDASSAITIPSSTYYPIISSGSGDVTIGNGGSLSLEAGTTSLTVKTGAALTLASGATVTTGTGSKIILESDAIYRNLGTSTPTLEVQRTLTGNKGWRMVASPVVTTYADMFKSPLVTQGFTGSAYPDKQPNLLWWDETDGGSTLQAWRTPGTATNTVTAGKGHFFYVFNGATLTPTATNEKYTDGLPKTMTSTGVENNNGSGNFDFSITKTARTTGTGSNTTDATAYAANEGWNLVGNPTASTLNWDASSGWTKTNLDNSIYVWDPSANEYKTWNGSTGTLGSGRIPPFQAFWVKANAASPALSFNNSAKSATAGTFLKNAEINTIVNIPVSLKGLEMETTSYLSISENGVTGEDPFDAYRLQPMSDSWLALYMNSSPSANLPLVINHLPRTFEGELYVPLYVDAKQAGQNAGGNFALQWQIPFEWPSDLSITLMDHSQKKAINMLNQADYKFSQTVLKGASAAAIDPLALPTQQVVPTALPGGNTIGLKSAQIQPFAIVIGKNTNSEPIYQDDEAMLLPIAPNPVTNHAVIGFRLPEKATVRIDIFSYMGRLVETLASGEYYSGLTELNWVPRNLAPGVYVVRLTSGTVVKTQKIVRMK